MMKISWTYCIVSLHEVYITYFIMDSKWKQETQRVFQRLRCTTYCSHLIGKMKWHMIGATYEFKILREAGCARWRCDKRQILVLSQNSFQIMKYSKKRQMFFVMFLLYSKFTFKHGNVNFKSQATELKICNFYFHLNFQEVQNFVAQ